MHVTLNSSTAVALHHGEVFTRRWVVNLLLDLTDYTTDRDLGGLRLLEPACGSGAFLGPSVERLIESAKAHGRDLATLSDAIRAYDLQEKYVEVARGLCSDLLTNAGASKQVASSLAKRWVQLSDFLSTRSSDKPVDVVVGNPPYIRYDDLPEETVARYRHLWPTMRGRGDIYVGFIERSLRMLAPEGKLGFICADRWMRNQYGAALRDLVSEGYAVEHVWAMHDVDAFERYVSAYPAIVVIANRMQGSTVVAETTAKFEEPAGKNLVKWSRDRATANFRQTGVDAHRLPHWFSGGESWPTGSPHRLALIEHLNNQFHPLHDPDSAGTKVAIGVATGADKVFITKEPTSVERDRILPLAMRSDLATGAFKWQGNYLINPWNKDGTLVSLDDYPLMAAYLSQHPKIRERYVARKDPNSWYRTIDKVNADLTSKPKLLIQDMRAHINPVLEPGGCYPHHNLYYIISDTWDMEVLGGLLLSRIAQAFIEAYCVRMRGDTLRFQAQYLKRIRVPDPTTLRESTRGLLRAAFRNRDVDAATNAAAVSYGIDLESYDLAPDGNPTGRAK